MTDLRKKAVECLKSVSFVDDDYDEEHRESAILKITEALTQTRLEAIEEVIYMIENQGTVLGGFKNGPAKDLLPFLRKLGEGK